jgi:hypothetical protein
MLKKILILSSALLLATAPTVMARTMVMSSEMGVAEQVEQEKQIVITLEKKVVGVTGASGMTLEVVSLTGRHVASYNIEGPSQRIELNLPKGCYILKVGKVVRKVTLH